jgi:hypothetical protein
VIIGEQEDRTADEYLTVAEVAGILKVSPKRIRNLMSGGAFRVGTHFFRRRGIGPRFLRSRLDAWLQEQHSLPEGVPMARGGSGSAMAGALAGNGA